MFPTLTARDLVEERADLVRWLEDPSTNGGQCAWGIGLGPEDGFIEARSAKRWATAFRAADLTWVDTPLVRTALATGDAFDDYTLAPTDLPSPQGFIAFAEPLTAPVHLKHITGMAITAASWGIHGSMVEIRWWTDKNSWIRDYSTSGNGMSAEERKKLQLMHPTKLVAVGNSGLRFGERSSWPSARLQRPRNVTPEMDAEYVLGEQRLYEAEKALVATWFLLDQTLIVDTPVQAPRAAMARIGRIDPSLLGTVRQVTLRHKNIAPDQRGQAEGPKREWAHRWVVRGHWRKRRKDARPDAPSKTWISPYWKGPEDAPLLDPSKLVNILKR